MTPPDDMDEDGSMRMLAYCIALAIVALIGLAVCAGWRFA